MKLFIMFAACFSFLLAQAAPAGDIAQSNPPAKSAAHSSASSQNSSARAPAPAPVRTSSARAPAAARPPAVAGQNQIATHPNPTLRKTNAAFLQPTSRTSVAMNVQSSLRNGAQTRQRADQPVSAQKVSLTPEKTQQVKNSRQSFFDALKRCRHERHDCNWWKRHCTTIVFVRTGFFYLDGGYWFPAYGYDPAYDYYDYDGPIYTYGNLLPDQVIANVQRALQELGYYLGAVTGSLGPATRAALANYQRDYGLIITGAIDEATVISLGLI